jgi:Terminase large subunit, T4likevirus-type, N-terminal
VNGGPGPWPSLRYEPWSAVSLLAACEDSALFGFPLWPRQRELLSAIERGPRLHVWALGRRSGKTTLAALVALWDCLLRPELGERVRPGERRHAVAVATNLRQARLFVRAALSVVERSPILGGLVEAVTEDEILFRNSTAISAFPCTSRGARGWPISSLLMDEAAFFISETEGPQVAQRVFGSLAPSTAQFGDLARIVVSSTPWGSDGFFAETWQRAAAGELGDAAAFRRSSSEMNPTLDRAFLAREEA